MEMKLSTGTKGALSELLVAADLMAKGYEVFRALSPSCSCDLIANNGKGLLRIECRTGSKNPNTGIYSFAKNGMHSKWDESVLDHYAAIYYTDKGYEIQYIPPLPEMCL